MPRRPALTPESFLAAIFHPSKNPLPTGLRKRSLAATPGRNKRRVTAYNKMTPAKQAVIDRSGNRDAYLRGDVTYADAKRALRDDAVERGVAKPLDNVPDARPLINHIVEILKDAHAPVINKARIMENVLGRMSNAQRRAAFKMDYATYRRHAKRPTVGDEQNPFWYR